MPTNARTRVLRSKLDQARATVRSWVEPWVDYVGNYNATMPGPYTSVFVNGGDGNAVAWRVTERTALAIAAVYRSLGIYADLVSTLPVQRLRGTERLDVPPFVDHPSGASVGWTDEIGQALWSLLLRGNAYLVPTAFAWDGYPETFVVLNPDAVAIERRTDGRRLYRVTLPNGVEREFLDPSPMELLHVRYYRPPGAWNGVGVLDVAGGPFGTLTGVSYAEAYAADVLANPVPPAVLQSALRLNKTQAEDLQAQWSNSVARKRAIPAVLSGGITYQALQVTPRDVELIESRRWNATQVAVLFGLPPYLVGGSTGDSLTYSTTELEMLRLWTTALMPATVRLERGFGAWTPRGQRLRFVPDALLRSQTLDRYQAHKIAIEAGFETVDEVRALENLAPLDSPASPAPAQSPPQLAPVPNDETEETGT